MRSVEHLWDGDGAEEEGHAKYVGRGDDRFQYHSTRNGHRCLDCCLPDPKQIRTVAILRREQGVQSETQTGAKKSQRTVVNSNQAVDVKRSTGRGNCTLSCAHPAPFSIVSPSLPDPQRVG